jgi:hypothetical protein
MVTLTRCFDAAYPPGQVPAGAGAVLGYIGPDPAAYHVWTPTQWRPFSQLRQFPCWVCDVSHSPEQQATGAYLAMKKLGWRQHRALVYDTETLIDPAWCAAFEKALQALGPLPVHYESESVIGQNGASRVWAALWDGRPVLNDQSWWAKQYMSGGGLDWSVVSPELLANGGQGMRLQ